MKTRLVKNEADLVAMLNASLACRDGSWADFFIALNGGLRSVKQIELLSETPLSFWVNHEIDDTEETMNASQWAASNVYWALNGGALYCCDTELLDCLEEHPDFDLKAAVVD